MAAKRPGVRMVACLLVSVWAVGGAAHASAATVDGVGEEALVDGILPGLDDGVSRYTLQFPPTLTHTISSTSRTNEIYGRIGVPGLTEGAGAAVGIRAQVGYGPDGTDPAVTSSWRWEEMAANVAYPGLVDDEYVGTLLPDSVGTFDYTTRWSDDDGATWHYTDLTGNLDGVSSADLGQLTVLPAADVVGPAAPVLSRGRVTVDSVALRWSVPADEDVAGYRLFRDGVLLPAVPATATSHTDTGLETGREYRYTVRAYDTSFNISDVSNEVAATPAHPPATVPTVRVPNVTALAHPGRPFLVSWSADGAVSYDVEWASYTSTSRGWRLGAWRSMTGDGTAETSAVFGAARSPVLPAQGQTYAFRARAANAGGTPTDWSPVVRASVPLDDRAEAISWSSGWTRATKRDRFLDTVRSSGRKGARATLRAQARGFTVIGDRCPACGKVRVLERTGNGRWTLVRTVDTRASKRRVRQVLYAGNVDRKLTNRSVRLEVVGTKRRPTVVLDAVAVRR